MLKSIRVLFVFFTLLVLASLACSSTSESISDAAKEATQMAVPTEADATTQPPAGEAKPAPTTKPTEVPPSPTPQEEAKPVGLVDYGFAQPSGIQVTTVFLIENPNATYAIEDSKYAVTLYDDTGVVLSSENGYIPIILPTSKLGVAVDSFLDEGKKAAKVEVQITSGDAQPVDVQGSIFTVEQVEFIPDDWFPKVTGIVKNGFQRNINDLKAVAVLYDEAGKIIGGGYTYLNFLNAGGETGVDVSVKVGGKPASAELYLSLSGFSVLEETSAEPPSLQLVSYGYGVTDRKVSVGFIVENFADDMTYSGSQYQVTGFDAEGKVLDTGEGYIGDVYPGEQNGGYEDLFLPEGATLDRVDVQIMPGKETAGEFSASPIVIGEPKFWQEKYSSSVTAVLTNTHTSSLTTIKLTALAYDETDAIIGGGYTYVSFVHPDELAGVDVNVDFSGLPARFELYSELTSLTSIKPPQSEPKLNLVAQGQVLDDTSLNVGFIVENTDATLAIPGGAFQVIAYDADGVVLDTNNGDLPVVFPGAQAAESISLSLPKGTVPALTVVQILADEAESFVVSSSPFTVVQADFLPDRYSPKVTGIVKSTYTQDIDYLNVTAILFDAAGNIIGSGTGYIDAILANGEASLEIYVDVTGTPDRVELFIGPSEYDF